MQKLPLRPLRLIRLNKTETQTNYPDGQSRDGVTGSGQMAESRREAASIDPKNVIIMSPETLEEIQPIQRDAEAHQLLQRAPNNYLFNQAYQFWLYISLFTLTLLLTHTIATAEYGMYARIQTTINTLIYITAFGLEDATANFVPSVFAEYGKAAAASLMRRMLSIRLGILLVSVLVLLFGLTTLGNVIAQLPVHGAREVAASFTDPVIHSHIWPIVLYVIGSGITNLLMAICASVMRMKVVLVIGSMVQLGLLISGVTVIQLGWGIDGVLWMQALLSLVGATGFIFWLTSLLFARGVTYKQPLGPVLRLSFSAWLNNLVSGALLKQVVLFLLVYYSIARLADTNVAFFNLSYQMADAANVLLVAGLSGVGASALAAAYVGHNGTRLARSWQALIKVETLIAGPGLIFCLFNAESISHTLYGDKFDAVGPLLAIFLFFNILVRITGSTIHLSSLYVVGKAGLVIVSQWVGLVLMIVSGILLIPKYGPAGALIADGLARLVTGILMLLFLLPTLPRHYPLDLLRFTFRVLAVLVVAALPSILWHPNSRILLSASGGLFLVLCLILFYLVKPLSAADLEMIQATKPATVRYLRWFARKK
ncbi:lipopolysaccharide biosynthesis protein [Tengunoibacter tsumagoiensis]|uniref:Uncharacterized protein n=1 Tax=Tengunoibacter tsumagoiensis TaxID=2014871 RepID=A0A402A1Y9_9CHLR|nr:polysaccharide biosynthesis C-terminal domain-containing protein [Tengunoibacter tsumagoiensis]GCE13072.1 hypothetical protein KTT_29310 [Tengunoibacter tsumagoiensis]